MSNGSPRPEVDLKAWAIDINARFEDKNHSQEGFNETIGRRVKRGSERIDILFVEVQKIKMRWAASAAIAGSIVAILATGMPFFWKWLLH